MLNSAFSHFMQPWDYLFVICRWSRFCDSRDREGIEINSQCAYTIRRNDQLLNSLFKSQREGLFLGAVFWKAVLFCGIVSNQTRGFVICCLLLPVREGTAQASHLEKVLFGLWYASGDWVTFTRTSKSCSALSVCHSTARSQTTHIHQLVISDAQKGIFKTINACHQLWTQLSSGSESPRNATLIGQIISLIKCRQTDSYSCWSITSWRIWFTGTSGLR